MMPPRPSITVVKLSDHGGQYVLQLKCSHCGHVRDAFPETFARIASWEALLATVVERLRCSRCHARRCVATPRRPTKRDAVVRRWTGIGEGANISVLACQCTCSIRLGFRKSARQRWISRISVKLRLSRRYCGLRILHKSRLVRRSSYFIGCRIARLA